MLTVTVFGQHDAIDHAISDELGRRGCRTHSVTVETGWLPSATHAIFRLDTAAGLSALVGLTAADEPGVHIVAVCEDPGDQHDVDRMRHLCEACSESHEVTMLWHAPLGVPTGQPELGATESPVRHLALAVVDEVAGQDRGSPTPSFSTRSVAN